MKTIIEIIISFLFAYCVVLSWYIYHCKKYIKFLDKENYKQEKTISQLLNFISKKCIVKDNSRELE